MGRRRLASTVAAAILAVVILGSAATSSAEASDPERVASLRSEGAPAERILVFSAPGLSWDALDPVVTPNLWRLVADSAMGNLTARTLGRPDLASGYLTLGAGTRAAAARTTLDGAGLEPDERFGEVTAREAFAVRTGLDVDRGLLQLGVEPILAANDAEHIDVVVGALGDRLELHGFSRGVVANADGVYPDEPDVHKRYAVNALMGGDGVVPQGRVGSDLLEDHTGAPFGVRYDNQAVAAAFRDAWTPRSVVLVEGSDLARADAFGLIATTEQAAASFRAALRRTDDLAGMLLAEVDSARDAVVLVSPTRARGSVLSAVAVRAPDVRAGLLSSASTRRRGYVLLADVAPTVLTIAGLARDRDMTGSRFTVGPPLSLQTRLDRLEDATEAAVFRDRVRAPVTRAYGLGLLVLSAVMVFARVTRRGRGLRLRAPLEIGGLALLAFVPVVYLARLFPFHDRGTLVYAAFLAAASLAIALASRAVARPGSPDALLGVLGLAVVVLVLDVLTGARLQLGSAFGYSATVGIRVAGFGNIAYAMLAATAILASGLFAHRIGGRRGAVGGVAVLGAVLVADIAPFWGGDVGGLLSLVPAFGATAALLLEVRLRWSWRVVAVAGTVTAVLLAAATAFDLSRPADARTHLGRLAQQVADQGLSPLGNTLLRKMNANLDTWTSSDWRLVLAVCAAFIVYLVACERDSVRGAVAAVPELRAALTGIALLAVLGYVFNDSGVLVPSAALSVASASMVVLLVGIERAGDPDPGVVVGVTPSSTPVPSP